MRFVVRTSGFSAVAASSAAALVIVSACTKEPFQYADLSLPPARDAGTSPSPVPSCGDAEDLPAGASRDESEHTLTLACNGDAKSLIVTILDDGLVRLRYGSDRAATADAARGSLVAIVRPPAKTPLVVGRRGPSAMLCTKELELAIEPHRCTLLAKDRATGVVVLQDNAGDGFFRGSVTDASAIGVVHASPANERFYGLGLHTVTQATGARRSLDLRGAVVELTNTDAFDSAAGGFRPDAPALYESIPFYVGLVGKTAYGLFTDNTHHLRFELAASDPAKVRATASGGAIDQYLIAGPAMRDVVRRYTVLTGRMPVPPPWALGFHQSRWEGPCDGSPPERPFCSAAQIVAVAQGFRDRGIPVDGLFLDIQHMNGFRSFTFDPTRFPEPDAFLAQLAALGFHVSAIVDPGIKVDPAWDIYQSGLAGGHFLKERGGSEPFQGEVWPGAAAFPDFSAPNTRAWWSDLAGKLVMRGVRGLWIDMNEPASFKTGSVPDDLVADGDGHATTMAEAHNAYAYLEASATYQGMKAARPTERPFVLSRAAFAGQQKWSAVWTGDAPSTWTTLAMSLPQLLHLGVSGIPFAGSDVGGYSGREESTAELFARWMALGAVSPFFRAHAEKDARRQEPWAFGTETLEATRALVSLRYELMPYLYSVFDDAARTGAPVLRPLVFEFQDDETTHTIADEAMLGPALLVAPVLAKDALMGRSVVLPGGRWFDFRSGAIYAGGGPIVVSAAPDPLPLDALPLFAREGAIIARTEVGANVAAARGATLFLDAFPGPAQSAFTLREDDGTTSAALSRITFTTSRSPVGVHFQASPRAGTYVAPHRQVVVRIRRVDHNVTSVKLDGAALPSGSFVWDGNDRALVVTLPSVFPFALDITMDTRLQADGDVDVPLRVKLPPGTPTTTPIHVANSHVGWAHSPLVRSGDEATGTMRAPRGGYTSFKITRGGWSTVEKGAPCVELPNRRAPGAATRAVVVIVSGWADLCP